MTTTEMCDATMVTKRDKGDNNRGYDVTKEIRDCVDTVTIDHDETYHGSSLTNVTTRLRNETTVTMCMYMSPWNYR